MRFLGHYVGVRPHKDDGRPAASIVIPKERSQQLRQRIGCVFDRSATHTSLAQRLILLNPLLRGWANFYRYAHDANRVFSRIDWWVWHVIERWLRKKHRHKNATFILKRYGRFTPGRSTNEWADGDVVRFRMVTVQAQQYRLGWCRPPAFAQSIYGEPGAQRKVPAGFGKGSDETD